MLQAGVVCESLFTQVTYDLWWLGMTKLPDSIQILNTVNWNTFDFWGTTVKSV